MPNAVAAPAAEDIDRAFEDALARDAHVSPPAIPGPPRQPPEPDPAAPHGRDTEGNPLAPYGLKGDGTPRIKPAGPGRGHRGADAPHVTDKSPAAAAATQSPASKGGAGAAAPEGPDYADDLMGLGTSLWMAASVMRGGKLLILKLPDTRAYAYVLRENLPGMVAAWNEGARQNATIRGWVEKLAGEGSWSWVLAVGVTSASFLGGCIELSRPENAGKRAEAAEANDAELKAFMQLQIAALGLPPEIPQEAAG